MILQAGDAVIIPLWFKLGWTAFVLYVMAVWWQHYGWRNYLWFSDIAFIGTVPALWLESAALASVLTVAVLLPELIWNVDFVLRLATRRRFTPLTDYMFERERPLLLRGLSLFHVLLPPVLLWMISAYGYDAAAGLPGAMVLAAIVLPCSRFLGPPAKNVNWTHSFGGRPVRWPAWLYLAALFAGFVLLLFVPTDQILRAAAATLTTAAATR